MVQGNLASKLIMMGLMIRLNGSCMAQPIEGF